jgi:hypothetical protein
MAKTSHLAKLSRDKYQEGHLVITIVIANAVLLASVLGLSRHVITLRLNSLEKEFKQQSLLLAQACAEHARLQLALNGNYKGMEQVIVSREQCMVEIVEPLSDFRLAIKTRAEVKSTHTKLLTIINKDNYSLVSQKELTN